MLPVIAIAICLYVAVSWLLWLRATGDGTFSKTTGAAAVRALVAAVVGLHGVELYRSGYDHGTINLALGHVVSLVTWMGVALFLVASLAKKRILNLGLIVMPSGLIGLVVGWLLPGDSLLMENLPRDIGQHIAIAIPAYGVLSIAFAQALLLALQERQLRQPRPGRLFPALPALETMESNLFQLILLGFILLSINLVTGMINTWQNYGVLLQFNHHILLALLAWGGFGGLLLGRRAFGWRGRTAAGWTVAAFGFLALAYFGTRFVSEVILAASG